MNSVSSEVIVAIALVAIAMFLFFGRKRQPKERAFKCSRCSAVSAHTPRTIEAWRAGKTTFFCNSCHGQWLRSQPQRSRYGRPVHALATSVMKAVWGSWCSSSCCRHWPLPRGGHMRNQAFNAASLPSLRCGKDKG